jgi:hypothetical protein
MKRSLTIAAAAMTLAACGENPVAPEATPVTRQFSLSAASPSLSLAAVPSDIALTLDDLRDRLLPTLTDASVAGDLSTLIAGVKSNVASGDLAEARRLVGEARTAVDPNGDESAANLGDLADLAVLRLTLANLDAALGS